MKQKTISLSAWMTISALAIIWGGSFLAYALILREVPVFSLVANRVFWASLTLWVVVVLVRVPFPSIKQWGVLFIMGILNNAIPFSLIAWGQVHIESGLASILNGTTTIFTFVLASLVFNDERLTNKKSLGIITAFVGVCTIIGLEALGNFDLRSLAQLSLLGACMSYAIAAVWARSQIKNVHPIMAATAMLTGSSAVLIPIALFIDGMPNYNLTPLTFSSMVFLSIPATAIAYLLYYRALRLSGSANLSLVTLLVPPMAIFWGAIFLQEKLAVSSYLGFALIAFGMLIVDGRLFGKDQT
jgi:drug/metabolite transporter (DMT)-like permease